MRLNTHNIPLLKLWVNSVQICFQDATKILEGPLQIFFDLLRKLEEFLFCTTRIKLILIKANTEN